MAQVAELGGHVLGGKYRLVRAISEGPRRVYEARHERLAGRFALKQWPATTPWDAFRRGAELAVTLRHPGVMQVLDFNCEPGSSPFLVLEWVDGQRLSDVIAESGIMPIERVAPLVESAAWALASAHQQGVVHQELRPDAVFVVHAPGTMREWVKLAGFGVSAALARAGSSAPSRYRAPEQKAADALEDDEADPQSDQYALAAIAYEMLAGVPPFGEPRERGGEGSRVTPLPISDLAPGVSPGVDAAIRQALAPEPEQRFAGVLEFARALRDAVGGASPEALRRRSAASSPPERRARAESVSPFFNPLQGRASEVIRRAVGATAKLRTIGRLGEPLPPGGRSAARIAIAGATLVLAVMVTALVLRKHGPASASAPTTAVVASPPAVRPVASPEPPPAASGEPPSASSTPAPREAEAPAAMLPVVAVRAEAPAGAAPAADEESAVDHDEAGGGAKRDRAAAWARLASGGTRATSKHARARTRLASASPAKAAVPNAASPKPAVPHAASPQPAPAQSALAPAKGAPALAKGAPAPAKLAAAPTKASSKAPPAAAGACVMSIGSRPPADIWLDDHSLGRRTPLVRYRTACGDHKLALKRTDLDLYQMEIVTLRAGATFKKVYPLQ
jgi:serine/threonine-protein kinase